MALVKVPWTEFKSTFLTFETPISFLENTEIYDIWMFVNGRQYNTIIQKTAPANSDQTDWETNYKSQFGNQNNIWTSARTTTAGELLIAQPPPAAPPNTTAVIQQYFDTISNTQDDFYVIPNGETLIIQRFRASCSEANDVTNTYLYYAPNGNTTGLVLLELIINNGGQFSYNLNSEFTGDGTAAILTRRDPLGGGSRIAFAKWEGYRF